VVSPESDTGWVWRHCLRLIAAPAPVATTVESISLGAGLPFVPKMTLLVAVIGFLEDVSGPREIL
jgi:hypothetical protein